MKGFRIDLKTYFWTWLRLTKCQNVNTKLVLAIFFGQNPLAFMIPTYSATVYDTAEL